MRTDVKVGVVAVVVLVLLVVVYFAFIRHSPSTADDNIVPTQQPELTQGPAAPDNGLGGAAEIPPTSQPDMGSAFNTPGPATQPDMGSTTQPGLGATTQTVLGGDAGMNGALNNMNGTADNGQPGQTTLTINSYSLAGQDYTIQPGDTLAAISKRVYGSLKFIKAIERANPGLDPRHLRVGHKIHMPPQPESPSNGAGMEELGGKTELNNGMAGTGAAATSAVTSQTYLVKPGDNLRAIALKFYHRSSLWTLIYHANRGVIGDDPNNVRVGEQLIIPAQQ